MVVGWGTDDVLGAATDDEEVTVLDAGDKAYALAALLAVDGGGEVLVQVVDETRASSVSRLPPLWVMIFPFSKVMMLQRMAKSSSRIS